MILRLSIADALPFTGSDSTYLSLSLHGRNLHGFVPSRRPRSSTSCVGILGMVPASRDPRDSHICNGAGGYNDKRATHY